MTSQAEKRKSDDYVLSRTVFEAELGGQNWFDVVRPYCMSLGDLKMLKHGQAIDVVSFYDGQSLSKLPEDIQFKPFDIFNKLKKVCRYTHDHGVFGFFQKSYEGASQTPFSFSAHVKGSWSEFNRFGRLFNDDRHYSEYPDSTFIGDREYMIDVEKLKNAPRCVVFRGGMRLGGELIAIDSI